jgi:hypothetical protein
VGRQIVQDDDIAWLEGGSELGFDVSFEDEPVHRRVDDEGRCERATAQAGDEGLCLPMSEGGLGDKPSALEAAAAQTRHFGRGSGLVQEDQPLRFKPHLRLAHARPFLARLFDVETILLAGPQSFF